jgi:protein-arginine kinase activator protein McsA
MSDKCPVTGKPCSKHRGYTVTEKKGDDSRSYAVCEDCMHLKEDLRVGDEHPPCSRCGTTLDSIVRSSKIGCAHCYEHFSEPMEFIVEAAQAGETIHIGRAPESFKRSQAASVDPIKFASDILADMKRASKEGRYEDARSLSLVLDEAKAIINRSDEGGHLNADDASLFADVVYRHMYFESAE